MQIDKILSDYCKKLSKVRRKTWDIWWAKQFRVRNNIVNKVGHFENIRDIRYSIGKMYDLVGSVPRRTRFLKNVRHEDAPGYESSRNGATGIRLSTEGRILRREKQKKKERKRRALWFMPVLWLPFLVSYWGVAPGIHATRILMQQGESRRAR